MEELFNKSLPVVFKQADRDEKQGLIGVTILLNVTTSPVHKKELIVRLTDENDPFFLFNLALGEEDFQGLKVQQGLLVDFAAFPQKFIDLLELCLSEASKEHPKFLLHFHPPPSDHGCSQLEVVEANPFRHLTHLSLKLVPASDSCLKKYLAECLVGLKEENVRLSDLLTATKSDLTAQLAQCQEALTSRSQELDRLKGEWSSHTASLSSEHMAQLTAEREKALQIQTEAQARHDREKKELEHSQSAKLLGLESHVHELESSNKELTDHKYRSQAAIRELKSKLKSAEEECSRLHEELQRLRRENTSLDSGVHEREKTIAQLRTRVAVLEQELKDKEQVVSHTAELLKTCQEQHRSCEVALEHSQRKASKLDTAFKSASQEVLKGNEIIQKLQGDIRSVKSKLKLRNVVTTQQEKLLGEKEAVLEKQTQEIQSLKDSITQKQEEVQKLEESVQSLRGKLEESRELLKTNENVIGWLNKQINEQMLGGRGPPLTGHLPPGSLSTIRHSSPLTHPHLTTSSSQPQHLPQFCSTPATVPGSGLGGLTALGGGGGGGGGGVEGGQRQVLGSLASQENTKQQVVFRGGPVLKTGAAPSPLSSHSLSAPTSKATTPAATVAGHSNKLSTSPNNPVRTKAAEEPRLDPKYLPHNPEALGAPAHQFSPGFPSSVTPGVLRPAVVGRGGGGGGGRVGVAGSAEQVPLLSAYFPNT